MRLQETSPRPSHASHTTTHFQPRTKPHAMQPLPPQAFITSHTPFHIPSFVDIKKGPGMYQSPYVLKSIRL